VSVVNKTIGGSNWQSNLRYLMAIRVLSPKSSVARNRSFLARARFLSSVYLA
jgi:hypothetical protein